MTDPRAAAAGVDTDPGADRSLLRSSSVMALGTVLSRITGLGKNVALVSALGTGILADTYAVANMLPTVIYTLFIGGAINAVFVPQLVQHRKDDSDDGVAYAQRLITAVGVSLLVLATVAVVAAPLVVRLYSSGWNERQLEVATAFARLMLPQIFFYGVYTILSQVLNTRERFGAPMFAPIVNNLVIIAAAVSFLLVVGTGESVGTITDEAIRLLGLGTLLGSVAQAAVLVPVLIRSGFVPRLRWDLRGHGLGQAWRLARWTIGLVLINQIGTLVVIRLATRANVESPDVEAGAAVYTNAFAVFMLPHSVITVSIVTALLPQLARIAHEGRFDVMREQVSWALRVTTSLLFPAAVTLLVLGVPVAVLLFGYGSVTEEGARLLGLTLAGFALGLPAFSAYYVILRGFYALSDTRTPMVNAGVLNGANIVLAYALFMVVPVDLRVPWLAVAYSLSYWLALALLAARLRRRIGGLEGYRVVRTTVRVAIATALAGGLMAVVLRAYLDGQPPTSASEAAIAFGLAVVPGALVFLGAARAMHIREVNQVLQLAGRR